MSHSSDLIATDIDAYLAEHERKDLLRLLTCGSVDDGKSTLIGRLLHDSNMVYADHLQALEADSAVMGSAGDKLDLALLMDGLKAEREQGITIDVAYRYFSTQRRKFIIADTPGHEQYTRNMVTGASTAQLAIVMVDARHGVMQQTKRHTTIASLLGIRHVVVAINKMDLVDWSQATFEQIKKDYEVFTDNLDGTIEPYFLPMSALLGDNVVTTSEQMPWFDGPPLMEHLETVDVTEAADLAHFRMPVQLVTRPDLDFRGFAGTIASGTVAPGDRVTAVPSGASATVERIVTFDGDLDLAGPDQAVTLTLDREIDVSRGDVFIGSGEDQDMLRAHRVDATLVWMSEASMAPGKQYLLQSATGRSNASVSAIRYRLDINTLEQEETSRLELNDIARCAVSVDRELLFDPYSQNRTTGSFILIDRLTNATVAGGMIVGPSSHWDTQAPDTLQRRRSEITPEERAERYGQRPATVLLTGLTGAGKRSIATALERMLFDAGRATMRLDGQNVRSGVSRDLGFTPPERSENVRRVAEVARLVNAQGMIAIAVLLAPEAEDRERMAGLIGAERYVEVFVDTPLEVCRQRDPGGLYSALDAGTVLDIPGVTSAYDRPTSPDLVTSDHGSSPEAAAAQIMALLADRGFISS
ncbi:Sulfate adenylyltransferase subunit 1 [Euzebya pacifica]|uniref:Sulfate adenylyltransferase subunit 1 n=1 Tax=Euzebya pacifica TaxID=1608957 RepID=A0A346Y151_9ACTN|nr:sulfate adenylyltransferase subunit CysN [Euzebya pacifica]AXV08198.1 Sulfate adenylyltransferase subunit 1 [Euzebya pacifica]